VLAISIFWFALNFHWSALITVVLPGQVMVLVGNTQKVSALAFVLGPGAFVSLIANPLFGWLSDHTQGRLACWGRRRPYILVGTLLNIGGLLWMATTHDIAMLALAYALVQFTNNAAQAPFHALLPDIVPEQQRGAVSGIMGCLMIGGTIAGTGTAGLLLDASLPPALYWHGLYLIYILISVVLFIFMLITVTMTQEKYGAAIPRRKTGKPKTTRMRVTGRMLLDIGLVVAFVWGLLDGWQLLPATSLPLSGNLQQLALETFVTIGLLRMFDFRPWRNPDFAWVLVTRFLVTMGMALIQNWIPYYLHDVLKFAHTELVTAQFLASIAIAGLCSSALAGWLSDRIGRKQLVYIAGGIMAPIGIIVIIAQLYINSTTTLFPILLGAGVIFGVGYGAYQSVDWALVADVLPGQEHFARDLGVWNISLSFPQILAPAIAGPLITTFTMHGQIAAGYQILFGLATTSCLTGTIAVHAIRGVKN
jgi:MFS family permease